MPKKKAVKKPTISLCMIVRNESANLRMCLDSVKDIVDEIVIVDTGSTDNTVAIAEKYTDKIYHFQWCDDFSAARNESLKYATKNWILILDADEILEKKSARSIHKELIKMQKNKWWVGGILIYSISKEYYQKNPKKLDYERFELNWHGRIIKNFLGLKFKYSLHELIEKDYPIIRTNLRIIHFGYHGIKGEIDVQKGQRAITCLKKDVEKFPNDLWVKFNLARTYAILNRTDELIRIMDVLIKDFLEYPEKRGFITLSFIYDLYIRILLQDNYFAKAQEMSYAWLTRLTDNYDPRPYVYLGRALFSQGKYSEAKIIFEAAEKSLKKKIDFGLPETIPQLERYILFFLGSIYLMENKLKPALTRLLAIKRRYGSSPDLEKLLQAAKKAGGSAKKT